MRLPAALGLWWSGLTLLYLLLVTSPVGVETAVGLAVGLASAVLAVAGARAFEPPSRVPGFVRSAVWLPVDVVGDAVILIRDLVTGAAFRTDAGAVRRVPLDDRVETRAWAVLLASAAPGSMAVEVEDEHAGLALRVHRMTPRGRALAGIVR